MTSRSCPATMCCVDSATGGSKPTSGLNLLDTTDRLTDLARESVGVGIGYGSGRYPELEATPLMAEEVFPVCIPSLVTRVRKRRDPDDLVHFKPIHDTTME